MVVAFGGRVFGVDPTTGRRIWTHVGETGQGVRMRVIVQGRRVFVMNGLTLEILDYASGALVTRRSVPHAVGATFMLVEGRLYVGGNGAVACFDLDGNPVWQDGFEGMGHGHVSFAVPGYSVQADLH